MITGQEIPLFGKLIMRHILLAGHGIEGAQGWWLSDPPLAKGEQGGFECVAGGFFVHRAVRRNNGSSVRQKSPLAPLFQRGVTDLPCDQW